jgi:hypothetical protein
LVRQVRFSTRFGPWAIASAHGWRTVNARIRRPA